MVLPQGKFNLSERIRRLPPYMFGYLNEMKYKKRRQGYDIIDFGMGNPDKPAYPHIIKKLVEVVNDQKAHRYSASKGIPNLLKEVARWYDRRYGVKLSPDDEVIAVIGSKEGLSHLSLALFDPGDVVLVPTPAFPIHIYSVVLAGASVLSTPLITDEHKFLNNLDYLVKTLYPKPKALIINFPHNPTTKTVEPSFFKEVVRFAKYHNIIVIHDFAYCDITYDGYKAPSFLQAEGAKEIGVEFITMSKSYNMAGWRIGFCVGNREIVQALGKIKGYYDYGIFLPIQVASIVALRESDEYIKEQVKVYERRRDVLVEGLNRIGWRVEKPKATMFVWAPIPDKYRFMKSFEFAKFLMEEANVSVSPGEGFGQGGEYYLRFSLVENEDRIRQAIRQIDKALKKLNKGV
jgi:alanine-synthesizing transaminase